MNQTVVIPRGPRLTGASWESALRGLPECERQRVAGFRFWENQQDSVLGWHLLAELAGAGRLERDPNGRPRAVAPVDVNLTHSGGWIAAASSCAGRIGIDVEVERAVTDVLAERCFAAPEIAWLSAAAPGRPRRQRFFRLWTAKEAYLKATGVGILTDLRRIAIDHSSGPPRMVGPEQDRWQFTVSDPAPGVWMTVCAEQPT